MTKSNLTVVVPVHNQADLLEKCLRSLRAQTVSSFDVVVVDDCSTDPQVARVAEPYAKLKRTPRNMGPAAARNVGIECSDTPLIAFTDSDCTPAPDWVATVLGTIDTTDADALMGRVIIPSSTYIGNAISCLGFPGGGWPGYRVMYDVDPDNYTNHLSTCNCVVRRKVFDRIGLFDETFPTPGREDTEFAIRLTEGGHRILFCDNMTVEHAPRTSIGSWIRMNIARGRGTYHLRQKVSPENMRYFKQLRLRSTRTLFLRKYLFDRRWPMMVFLYGLMLTSLWLGHRREARLTRGVHNGSRNADQQRKQPQSNIQQ